MITTKEKEIIQEVHTKKYSPAILNYFRNNGIVNSKGSEYSAESIRQIVCGKHQNLTLEGLIMDFTYQTDKQQKALKKSRDIKSKKI
jgi:hypothetical protein